MAAATAAAAAAAALRPHITLLSGGSGPIPSTTLQVLPFLSPLPFRRRGRSVLVFNASSSPSSPPTPEKEAVVEAVPVPTAESCVNLGLELFSKGRVRDALEQFENALELNPTPIEAQAALYNKACCHAYRKQKGSRMFKDSFAGLQSQIWYHT